ncbi:MAG TPA: hypothetical protein IAC45_00475 [Candidatus Aphodousia faecavium]|nr:hypothetical protein [Candidatus Aphodousia faecavium]
MTWHLKNRKLEEKIIGIDADFSERLNQLCEKWDSNKDNDLCKYKKFSVPFHHGSKLHGEVTFLGDEVEKIIEYNPQDWNSFPEVIPPENVWMRLEIKANDSKHISREVAFFHNGEWRNQWGPFFFDIAHELRFRPWEDKK